MKEITPFSQEEQEAIKAIMLEYLTNCQLIILCSTEPHGFYTLKRKHWMDFIPRFEELLKIYNITEDRIIEFVEADLCTPLIWELVNSNQILHFDHLNDVDLELLY